MVDLFIFHDDLQYTKNDWRNRNKIKTSNGGEWLTIPVGDNEHRLISEVVIKDNSWQKKHWKKIQQHYNKAACYSQTASFFEEVYLAKTWNNLSELNQYLIKEVCEKFLDIETHFEDSRNYNLVEKKEQRVLELLKKCNATTYLSGPAAKDYLSEENFAKEGIELEWMNYSGYQEYPQLFPPFKHDVSIIDLIFNTGSEAKHYLKYSNIHV